MFQGFSQETVDFMWGIRFNNEKSWFEANKESYLRSFYTPMKELGAEVQEKLLERFPDSQLNLKISRIYRDARRLFGRGPYKDHLWFSIRQPAEEWVDKPTFWFELAQEGGNVLLSPACASFDMFKDYEQRGAIFKEIVNGLESRK